MQFPGTPVELGVRGEAAGQPPGEVARPERVQLIAELVGQRPGLHRGQVAPGVADDVGVGGEVHIGVHRPGRPSLTQGLGQLPGAHPAVAVPLRLSVPQPHAVHHPRAQEPVPLPEPVTGILQAQRVGPVAQIASGQPGRHAARHRQVERGDLILNRGKRALQEAALIGHG